jgi:hypothetical protein
MLAGRMRLHVAAAVGAALLLVLLVPACGSDQYSGTWRSTTLFQNADTGKISRSHISITKSGDGWTVVDGLGNRRHYTESNGELVNPSAPQGDSFELRGIKLALLDHSGHVLIEFTRQ